MKWLMVVGGGRRLRPAAGCSRSASRLLAPRRGRSARRWGIAPGRGGGARAVPRRLDPTASRRASRPLGVAHSLPPPPPAAFGDWPASLTNGGPPAPASPARGGARLPRGAVVPAPRSRHRGKAAPLPGRADQLAGGERLAAARRPSVPVNFHALAAAPGAAAGRQGGTPSPGLARC